VMESALVKRIILLIILSAFFAGCKSTKGPRPKAPEVPMTINIKADNSVNFTNLNANFYRLNVKDALDDFLSVYPVLVDEDQNPQIIVDITIENFSIGMRDERRSRRVYSRNVQVGADAKGQPVYQTVTATADIVETQIPSNARLSSKLTIKGPPAKVVQKNYYERYTWQNISVENIQGDQRAVDPSLYSRTSLSSFEPDANEILMTLSNREMLKDLSYELRRYYQKPKK
jgi:hypothetical protein